MRIASKFRLPSRKSYIRSHGYQLRAEGGARDAHILLVQSGPVTRDVLGPLSGERARIGFQVANTDWHGAHRDICRGDSFVQVGVNAAMNV
jgi:hypothetical protein